MRVYTEDELIPISSLQHLLYCERQFALIHLEQIWEENQFTAEGRVLHERVDVTHHESRRAAKTEYGMAVRSLEYGLIGKADLVEFERCTNGSYMHVQPVEFKRGRNKASDVDRVQLCAQAICIEEMLGIPVETGQFYYLQEHRRSTVEFTVDLRSLTAHAITRARELIETTVAPPANYGARKCDRCSLMDRCMPKALSEGGKSVARYVAAQVRASLRETSK